MNPIELRAVWKMENGAEAVQTGIYVPDTTTLADVRRLMAMYGEHGEKIPDMVEFDVRGEEEAKE